MSINVAYAQLIERLAGMLKDPSSIPGQEIFFTEIYFIEEIRQMEKKKNNNSSNPLADGRKQKVTFCD